MRASGRVVAAALTLLAWASAALVTESAPAQEENGSNRDRAIEAMTFGGEGPLEVETALVAIDPSRVEVALRVAGDLPAAETMMVTTCFAFLDMGDRCLDPFPVATPATAGRAWEGTLIADLPDEPVAVGIYVRSVPPSASTGALSGTGSADAASDALLDLAQPQVIDLRPPQEDAASSEAPISRVVRLVPPPETTLTGNQRFRVLASDPRVDRVVFQLDGELVASDGSHPYSARINLGPEARQQAVTVIAFASDDAELGRDTRVVNERTIRNRIHLTGVADDEGRLEIAAELTLAPGIEVKRVEVSYSGTPIAELTQPPFTTTVDIRDAGPSDFVQAVATLSDGSTIEDVLLPGAAGMGEEIEVHLTELYAVFFDRDTESVLETVTREDVDLVVDGAAQPIERFARADERPLTVGLVIDTSSSMYALIPDTQRAAGRFLSGVLRPGDRAFLVDFDTRPRLAHGASEDRQSLISRLAVLSAEGFTALFDSIVYSTLEFPADGRRRALVVLTDGDDYKSKLGPGNAIEYAEAAGVPVYIISLAGIHLSYQTFGTLKQDVEPVRKPDIEKVARATGGRVFYISDPQELPAAYDRILKELTHQYLVTFSTPSELTDDQRASIGLKPTDDDVKLRFTVGRPES